MIIDGPPQDIAINDIIVFINNIIFFINDMIVLIDSIIVLVFEFVFQDRMQLYVVLQQPLSQKKIISETYMCTKMYVYIYDFENI